MIKIIYQKKDNQINQIQINGHANYAEFGKDIVCASVSCIAITSINGILSINDKAIKYTEGKTLSIKNLKNDEVTNKLLANMLVLLKDLAIDYPKNIEIREEE